MTLPQSDFPQANRTFSLWQGIVLCLLLLLTAFGIWCHARPTLLILNGIFTLFYLLSTLHRILVIHTALCKDAEIHVSAEEISQIKEWPRYIILLPLFHEAEILPHLVQSLLQLDYPTEKLDIRLLIEEDDQETLSAAQGLALPPHFHIIPIPYSLPRTKPKACNVALMQGEADFLVIYDAEDRPEPDQLKKAVCAFAKESQKTVCIQAKLDYENASTNLLTSCFGAEYDSWFGLCLPGLSALNAPLPLGGTSNHFRLQALRDAGGWDPYNVTEDCDLGLRIFEKGGQTKILDSLTYEQACDRLLPWLRQRSRWVKGYIQTWLVHTRNPLRLHRSLGFWNSIQFHLLIGGTFFSLLINPFYWLMTCIWILFRPTGVDSFFPPIIFAGSAFCLFAGNFIFLYATAIACVRKKHQKLAKFTLLMPFYWLLMSLGAWKGFLQLFLRPHHWEKTPHFQVVTKQKWL